MTTALIKALEAVTDKDPNPNKRTLVNALHRVSSGPGRKPILLALHKICGQAVGQPSSE